MGVKLNVLSLFDGMSCARIALDRAGIGVNRYFAAETDKYAIKVAQANYPDTIQLGDVRDIMWPETFEFEKINDTIGKIWIPCPICDEKYDLGICKHN